MSDSKDWVTYDDVIQSLKVSARAKWEEMVESEYEKFEGEYIRAALMAVTYQGNSESEIIESSPSPPSPPINDASVLESSIPEESVQAPTPPVQPQYVQPPQPISQVPPQVSSPVMSQPMQVTTPPPPVYSSQEIANFRDELSQTEAVYESSKTTLTPSADQMYQDRMKYLRTVLAPYPLLAQKQTQPQAASRPLRKLNFLDKRKLDGFEKDYARISGMYPERKPVLSPEMDQKYQARLAELEQQINTLKYES